MSDRVNQATQELLHSLYDETDVEDYQPIRDRVLVYPLQEKKAQTKGDLWVPDDDKPKKGVVISVGPGIMTKKGRLPPDCKEGDVIVMGSWIGEVLTLNRETYRLVRAPDILAVLNSYEEPNGDG